MRIESALACAVLLTGALATGCKKGKDDRAKVDPAGGAPAVGEPANPAGQPGPAAAGAPMPGGPPGGAGAAGPVERPASVSPEEAELAGKMVADMEAIAEAATANQADCTQAARAMKKVMDDAHPDIEKAESMSKTKNPAAEEWFQKTYQQRMMATMQKLGAVANKCKDNKDFSRTVAESPFMGGHRAK